MGFWRFRSLQDGDERSFASGELEYESERPHQHHALLHESAAEEEDVPSKPRDFKLIIAFFGLVIAGTANTVLNKLQAVPLYNYPNFINTFGNLLFIPITFAYILPAYRYGWFNQSITRTQWKMSLQPFAIMGALDCVAGMMQVFCAVYLPGPLLVLLPQAAIPISMIFSKHILGARYRALQYVGALVVLVGIVVVLEPEISHRNTADYICEAINMKADCSVCQVETTKKACLSHRLDDDPYFVVDFARYASRLNASDDPEGTPVCAWIPAADTANGEQWLVLIWSGVMILSCFPMALSTIYKELVLDDHMDPVFLNGWIVVFQTMYSFILAVPAGMASTPAVLPKDVPQNLLDGVKCYLDINTIEDGCHPDDCSSAALYFNLSICVNVFYILAAMFVVKWGSTSLLFLGLTIMVPLGNLAFAILPSKARTTFHVSDILGLLVILLGLLLYRFSSGSESDDVSDENSQRQPEDEIDAASVDDNALDGLKEPLLQGDALESQAIADLLAVPSSVLPHMDSSIPLDHQEICEEQSLSPPCPRTVDL